VTAERIELRVREPLAHFDLDVSIETRARCLGIFGPSGSGKTSLLEAVAGWRPRAAGFVRVGERVLLDSARSYSVPIASRAIGYVPQDVLLFPQWSVRRNVLAGIRAREEDLERAAEVLEIRPLLDRSTHTLSGGERSRVGLARALCSSPDLLLLDEPFGSLDVPLRRRVLPYLLRAREAYPVATLFVSHDATEVQALCDVVVVLDRGRVRAIGPPADVLPASGAAVRGLDNVLSGPVVDLVGGTARVEIAPGVAVQVPAVGLALGERAVFALGADEILVSIAPISGISARNLLEATIDGIETRGEDALARASFSGAPGAPDTVGDAHVLVGLTQASVRELDLRPGKRVHLVFKTQSCRVLSARGTPG
jgi:molybdate transport system ATP-binding protein